MTTIQAPDPSGRYSDRYYLDLAYRETWDAAHRKARMLIQLFNVGEFRIPALPPDAYDSDAFVI